MELDPREAETRAKPTEEIKSFQLNKEVSHCTKLGCQMSTQVKESIAQVLTKNVDLFTWLAFDMLGTDPECHYQRLTICPKARLIAQRKRKLGPKRAKFVDEKAKKLLNEDLSEIGRAHV